MNPPRIAITMGDPAAIGPEIRLRLLNDLEVAADSVPIIPTPAWREGCTFRSLPRSWSHPWLLAPAGDAWADGPDLRSGQLSRCRAAAGKGDLVCREWLE